MTKLPVEAVAYCLLSFSFSLCTAILSCLSCKCTIAGCEHDSNCLVTKCVVSSWLLVRDVERGIAQAWID